MDSLENNPNWKKIEEDFCKMVEEIKKGEPVVDNRPFPYRNWHITVPKQNEPS